jgi:transcriptional regulator with XRE-family HTH domain
MATWQDPETEVYGLSQNKLRELSGVSQAAIYEILKQGHSPKPEVLIRLAEFFEVSPFTLFRLAYMPDSEESGWSPDIQAQMSRLESILSRVPAPAQVQFLESLLNQARMLATAAEQWTRAEEGAPAGNPGPKPEEAE